MKKKALVAVLGMSVLSALSVGCALNQEDAVFTAGREGSWPAIYVTFKRTPSAQLLGVLKIICKDDGACVLNLMKQSVPNFSYAGFGQAEYNEALNSKYASQARAAISAVQSVNAPAACVRVTIWKEVGWGVYTHARWSAINNGDCRNGGSLTD
ncbi:MAG TPA: hypothetical protein VI072_07160 [Polyangiaceae bacterium]